MKPEHFQAMYAAGPDPWGFTSRWYEQRKYAVTLAALPRPRYRHVFEPGCSIGVLTEQLAARADRLLACDLVAAAVERTSSRLAGSATATAEAVVRQWDLRGRWPDEVFDLVVVSEVLYYLEPDEAATFMAAAVRHLDPDGQVVVAHWRPVVPEYPMTGDQAHRLARATPGIVAVARYEDEDFLLDVFARKGTGSVAAAEGLR